MLLRPGVDGLEVLLTQRPSTMTFAADVHVFPGGSVDPADADPSLAARSALSADEAAVALGGDLDGDVALALHMAAIRELFEEAGILLADTEAAAESVAAARSALVRGEVMLPEVAAELGLVLRTDLLVPLSRWVTPASLPRRFDTRFFAAALGDGVEPSFEGTEVAAHVWLRPKDALAAMAAGELDMWPPTRTTLQQLEHAESFEQIRDRLAAGIPGRVEVDELSAEVTRIEMPAGGGVPGQSVWAYLVGRRRFVLVDPGDPTSDAIERVQEIVARRAGALEAVALTHVDPDHSAGAHSIARSAGVAIFAGPGAASSLPYEVTEVADMQSLPAGDVRLVAMFTPGPRPDHLAFLVGAGEDVLTGDLDGVRGARMIPGPLDDTALAASRERLRGLAPTARSLPGHPPRT